MTDSAGGNPRLTRRLKRALLTILFVVLVLATGAATVTSYLEASDIQDEILLSVARLVETDQMGAPTEPDGFDDDDVDDSAVRFWRLGSRNRHGINFDKTLNAGFHTLREDGDFWRVYVTRESRGRQKYVVAQKLDVSAEIALNSAKTTALPLLLLFLLVPLLVSLVVRHSFKPLNDLTTRLGNSDALQLDVANRDRIPVEVMPFVSAIDSLLEKNEAHNQRQRRFIADAAHELRTPITALSLEIDNVQSARSEASKHERQVALSRSVDRLQRLVNQLLDLARAQSGLTRDESLVCLDDMVRSQIADIYPLVERRSINMEVTRIERVQLKDVNHQLQHVVRNALSNAIKFTPDGGSIRVAVFSEGPDAVFCVSDTGPGVPEEQLERLHQPFYRPEGQASGQGAGLGLAICHEIAAQLDGRVSLSNVEPHGFRFCYRQARVVEKDRGDVEPVLPIAG